MRISLLGGFLVRAGSRRIEEDEWHLRKAASLVKLLALVPGHRLHRERVMDLFWPELGTDAAANNLRYALHHARRILEPGLDTASGYLRVRDEQLALSSAGRLWIDVEAFEEAAASARRARVPAAYRVALDLYGGELLPGEPYEDWLDDARSGLRTLYLALLVEMARIHEEREDYGPAVEALGRVIEGESAHEEAHVALMRLYAISGRRTEAIRQYERLRVALRRELAVEPAPASSHVYEDILAGRYPPARGAPARLSPEDPPGIRLHNLPPARTSFVGRERELGEVRRTLAMTALLTLTGAGGSGKTRLALEAARDLVGVYPDGVWFVELAPLSDPGLVPQAVAGILGVREQQNRPLLDALAGALQKKNMLLVLDNCEHLVDGAARLVDTLLDSCPGLRILATSREPLGIAGEVSWQVPSLSLPEVQGTLTVEQLEGYESAQLFMERALYRPSAFILSPENSRAVAEICRQLDGIPLAIELAAARVGALAVAQISERLSDSLKLLTGGGRTATPRQQTLRGALDWSYDLLSGPERKLFVRLSAFSGGWTLEAVEVVGAGDGIEREEVLDLISRLVDKSLVVAESVESGVLRYRMLETVRQYTLEKLEESGEAETVRCRHAAFFLALAEEADPMLEGAQQAEWLERLETEHDNLRAALSWSLERDEDAGLGLRMSAALGEFWYLRGYREGRRWLEEALAKAKQTPTAARARALQRVSWLAIYRGDLDWAESASQEGLGIKGVELFRTGGGDSVAAELQRTLGLVVVHRGEFERAIELFEESLALSRKAGNGRGVAISLRRLGLAWRGRGNFERATEFFEEALAHCRESGDPALIATILAHLGMTFVFQGDTEQATEFLEEATAMFREQRHRVYLALDLAYLGWAALLRGDPEQARALLTESLGLQREVDDKPAASESLGALACVSEVRGETGRAARLFGAAEILREVMGFKQEPGDRVLQEPYLAAVRSQLDEATWEAAFAEGRAMSFEETVEYALSRGENAPLTALWHEESSVDTQQATLTHREHEVVVLLAGGLSDRKIAGELSISERTVTTHVGKILKKLNFQSRSQVAAWAVEQRLPRMDQG